MVKLPVAAFLAHLKPAVSFQSGQHFMNLRRHPESRSYRLFDAAASVRRPTGGNPEEVARPAFEVSLPSFFSNA